MSHTLIVRVLPSKQVIVELHDGHDVELLREQLSSLRQAINNFPFHEVEATPDRE